LFAGGGVGTTGVTDGRGGAGFGVTGLGLGLREIVPSITKTRKRFGGRPKRPSRRGSLS